MGSRMKLLMEQWKKYLKENTTYISIHQILPTEELGHGKEHECPSAPCEEKIQAKIKDIEDGNFEPIKVCQQKPVVTARLQGEENYDLAPKSGIDEPFFHVLDGHHRLLAAQRLGLAKIPVVRIQK